MIAKKFFMGIAITVAGGIFLAYSIASAEINTFDNLKPQTATERDGGKISQELGDSFATAMGYKTEMALYRAVTEAKRIVTVKNYGYRFEAE